MLGCGMKTSNQSLSCISNNLSNVNTTGYKKQEITSTTFGSMMMQNMQTGNPLGNVTLMKVSDQTRVIHSQGTLEETQRALDFAIQGEGFFAVQAGAGIRYTRNGCFAVDQEGYLATQAGYRVQGDNGPIQVGTDQITADDSGVIYVDGQPAGRLAVVQFEDYAGLQSQGEGLYTAAAQGTVAQAPTVSWQTLERSNINSVEEMTDALAAQRHLQSCSQALQMVNSTMEQAVTEIGRV